MAEESGIVALCPLCRKGDTGTYYSTREGLVIRYKCAVLGGQLTGQAKCEMFVPWVKEIEQWKNGKRRFSPLIKQSKKRNGMKRGRR